MADVTGKRDGAVVADEIRQDADGVDRVIASMQQLSQNLRTRADGVELLVRPGADDPGNEPPTNEPPGEPPSGDLSDYRYPMPEPPLRDMPVLTPDDLPSWDGRQLGNPGTNLRQRILDEGGPDIKDATRIGFTGFTLTEGSTAGWTEYADDMTVWLFENEIRGIPGGFVVQDRPTTEDLRNDDGRLEASGTHKINSYRNRFIDCYVPGGSTGVVQVGMFLAQGGDQAEYNSYGDLFVNCGSDGPDYPNEMYDHGIYRNWNYLRGDSVNGVYVSCGAQGGKHPGRFHRIEGNTYIDVAIGASIGADIGERKRSGPRVSEAKMRGNVGYALRDLTASGQALGCMAYINNESVVLFSDNVAINPVNQIGRPQRPLWITGRRGSGLKPVVTGSNNHAYGYEHELVFAVGEAEGVAGPAFERHGRASGAVDIALLKRDLINRIIDPSWVRGYVLRQCEVPDPMGVVA